MLNKIHWRQEVWPNDVGQVRHLVESVNVFSAEEVQVAGELVESCFKQGEASGYSFLFADYENQLIAYACFGSIPFTDKRYDLYWIAVSPAYQRWGLGKAVLQRSEQIVRGLGGIHLYTETSGRADYQATRDFYGRNGYERIAEMANFYREGESKVVYCKPLSK
jgi:GNAT superfamily N-acetyltransferase